MKEIFFIHFRTKNWSIVSLLWMLTLSAPPLFAELPPQPEKTKVISNASVQEYTIEALIERTLSRSEWLHSLNTRVEEIQFSSEQTRRFQNPEFSFSAGQKTVSSANGSLLGMSLSQPFLLPGKRDLRFGIADSDKELAEINKSKVEISLIYDVLRTAYQHEINHQRSSFLQKRQERFELIKSYLAGRTFATPQKKMERHVVESRLRKLISEGIEIETSLKDSLERLKLYVSLGDDADPRIHIPWIKGSTALDKNEWQAKAIHNNLDLAAQRLLVHRANQEQLLAQKEKWPDFSLSAFYGQESAGETERTLGAGFAIPIPVLNRNNGNIRSFGKKHEAEKQLLAFQERELKSRLQRLLNEVEAARKNVSLYPQSLFSELQNQEREAEDAFRKGQLDLLLFLEIDEQIAETYYRALDAQLALVDKLTNLFFMTGEKDLVVQLGKF